MIIFSLMSQPPPTSTLFPYTTLFRSPRAFQSRSRRHRHDLVSQLPRPPAWRSSPHTRHRLLVSTANALDRKSTRLNSSHVRISYAVFCLIKNNVTLHIC